MTKYSKAKIQKNQNNAFNWSVGQEKHHYQDNAVKKGKNEFAEDEG